MSFKSATVGNVPGSWTVGELRDFLSLITYGFTNPMPDADEGPWKLTAKDVVNGVINYSTARKTTAEAFKNKLTDKSRPKLNDVLLTKDGSIGRVAVVDRDGICINQSVALLRPNEKIDPYFLKYLLISPFYQQVMEGDSDGSTIKHIYITRVDKMEVAIPPLDEQRQILSVVGTLDDRINLLRETNATLEAIAQALFKSWFVDFDPVHANAGTQAPSLPPEIQALFPATFTDSPQGPIPEGWSYVNLGELVCNQSTTFKFQGIDKVVFINTGDVSEGLFLHQDYVSTDGLPGQAKKAIQRDDILFSEIRPKNKRFAYVNLDPKDYVVSTKFMVLRAISDVSPRYIYQILKQDETIEFFNMIAESRSGTFPQITFDSIQTYQVLKPSKACVDKFIGLVSPIIEQIDLTSERQKELSILRDTLLPRLISGQLRLPEAEQAIAAITD